MGDGLPSFYAGYWHFYKSVIWDKTPSLECTWKATRQAWTCMTRVFMLMKWLGLSCVVEHCHGPIEVQSLPVVAYQSRMHFITFIHILGFAQKYGFIENGYSNRNDDDQPSNFWGTLFSDNASFFQATTW